MSVFHRHKWVETARRFTPSAVGRVENMKASMDVIERATHGFTTVELRCEGCGLIRLEAALGDQTK